MKLPFDIYKFLLHFLNLALIAFQQLHQHLVLLHEHFVLLLSFLLFRLETIGQLLYFLVNLAVRDFTWDGRAGTI